MFGWYANWGITHETGIRDMTNLDQIEFLDFNEMFTIGTIYHEGHFPVYPTTQDMQVVPGQMLFRDFMGSDFDKIRCGFTNLYGDGKIVKALIPSVYDSIPNTLNKKIETSGKCCCHIVSLHRLIVWDTGSSHRYSIYNVNEDGSIAEILYVQPLNNGYTNNGILNGAGQNFGYYIFGNLTGDGDISNSSNYVNVFAYVNTSSFRFMTSYIGSKLGIAEALFGYSKTPDIIDSEDPYDPIDPSGPTDPDSPPGDFDDESDPIPDSPIPTLSSANTGFTRIYNPTLAQVRELANYLWTDETVISTIWNHIKQYFEDPMQAIIGFNLVPVPVPDGGIEEFKLMYIGTGVNMTVAASQFVDIDCGTLELKPYYGSYLDYAPYTKISCFLPYIGNVEINPDEVMNTTLQVKYRVDICSGSCVAKILVDNNCLYQYSGHCAIPIPFASADFSSYVSAAISVAKLGVGVATAGALGAAGLEAGEVAQATTAVTTTNTERNPATGRQITMNTQTVSTESSRETKPSPASYAGITPRNVSNTVGQIMGSKPAFQHSGSFSGNTGYLGVRRPFLIITRPNLCLPESYKAMNGYPAMITMNLSDCTGFTQVQQIQFSGSSATNPEVDEILQFLKSGVIF